MACVRACVCGVVWCGVVCVCDYSRECVFVCAAAAATGVPSMTSMIPPLNRAPMNSRLHNVRQAVNCLDRMR